MSNKVDSMKIKTEIINRLIQCCKIGTLYVFGTTESFDVDINIENIDCITKAEKGLLLAKYETYESFERDYDILSDYCMENHALVYIDDKEGFIKNNAMYSEQYSFVDERGILLFKGKEFRKPEKKSVPEEFRVLCVIHTYNEEDVIEKLTHYLINEGMEILFVDNWSSDLTFEIEKHMIDMYPNKIHIERFPNEGPNQYYDWYHQLERTEQIAKKMDYDWYIHYDADEMRITPWENVTIREMLYQADIMGYTVVENTVVDFKLTDKATNSIFMEDGLFEFGRRAGHFEQQKTWKRVGEFDIKSTGGHLIERRDIRIYPLKICNRHYPFRSVKQAEKKVFRDRKPRFEKEKKERGWHHHYDCIANSDDFICKSNDLIQWNRTTRKDYFIQLFLGCGIDREVVKEKEIDVFLPDIIKGKRIAVYGAGKWGGILIKKCDGYCQVNNIVDKEFEIKSPIIGKSVESPKVLEQIDVDFVLIAIKKSALQREVRGYLNEIGFPDDMIIGLDEIDVREV